METININKNMKVMHIYATSTKKIVLPKKILAQLPKGKILGLTASIQHSDQLVSIQKQLPGSIIGGQTLGCRTEQANKLKNKVDAFLFIGTGFFHPIKIALNNHKPVYCYDPESETIEILPQEIIDEYEDTIRKQLTAFLFAKKVGILVSVKNGQHQIQKAKELAARKDKEYFLFAVDTLEYHRLEDFNFINIWVNTACNRISDRKPNFVEIDDVLTMLKQSDEEKSMNIIVSR